MEFQPLVEALDAIDKPGIIALTEAFNEAYVGEDEEALATSGKVAELRSTLADELANIEEA